MRLAIVLALLAGPAPAEALNEILHGEYAPGGSCGEPPAVIVGPEGVQLQTTEGSQIIEEWSTCTTCKPNAERPGLLLIATPAEGDANGALLFEAVSGGVALSVARTESEGEIDPPLSALAGQEPYLRCVDAP